MSLFSRILPDSRPDEFDLKYGVRTAGKIPRWRLLFSSLNAVHGVHYQPVGEQELHGAIDFLNDDLSRFTFIDLGCGKGRALVIAERYPFRSIIGVEYNRALAAEAAQNARRSQVICADAAGFEFPDDDLVLFLYNPFSAKIMAKVVAKLEKHRRKFYVLYCNPKCADLFDGFMALGEIAPFFRGWKSLATVRHPST